MILTEKVKIKINKVNINYIKFKGYKCNLKDIIEIKTEDLSKGSHIKIKVKCDICDNEKELKYQMYYKNFINCSYYSCSSKCAQEKVKKTSFKKFGVDNYSKTKEYKNKIKETCLKKYGVDNYSKTKEYKDRFKKTCLKKYGVVHPLKNDYILNKMINTNLKKYGFKAPTQNKVVLKKREQVYLKKYGFITNLMCDDTKNKIKKTCLEKYGFENISQNEEIKQKKIQTCNINYGVDNPLQNEEIFEKQQKSSHCLKKFKDISYRGTYELDFLEKFYDKIKIEKAKPVDYIFECKNKKYYPDFYLPKYNLIVEIKSSYTYDCEKEQNEAKKEATINKGYNFIFIINKDYYKLLSFL